MDDMNLNYHLNLKLMSVFSILSEDNKIIIAPFILIKYTDSDSLLKLI